MTARDHVTKAFVALRAMEPHARAQTIVSMFMIAAAEFAAMVLEHNNVPAPLPPKDPSHRWIRETLAELDVGDRCEFLAGLFGEICREFAALVEEQKAARP